MLKIKRLYLFTIETFLPVFIMTFGICLFIVLMQFLWRYVEDLVGKGLDNIVLGELFFYAGLNLIPLALPLSILLASLMAFGNLGERLELLAIKAAGVSLLKMMRPLIVLILSICIGAFFFQNEAMPRIGVKLASLLWSIKQKSPELQIPEGAFYNGINNYNIYVKKKNPETKILHDVIIYDTSNGFDNMSVYVCDSGLMRVSANKDFLLLNLYYGQQFANFRQSAMINDASRDNKFRSYARENFKEKKIVIPFDASFKRMDESNLEGTQISKNMEQLDHSIDSMSLNLDSINQKDRLVMKKYTYLSYRSADSYIKEKEELKVKNEALKVDFDSLISSYDQEELIRVYNSAVSEAENNNNNYLYQSIPKIELQTKIRQHKIEWHRKFTLSFACLIFFFIGAPLGAIIRKGGLGMPVVVSVILFIVYYIINNVGYKLARDGVWEVWQGMWLSSVMLFPLGVFLTYKAMNDSALFNPEVYGKYIRKILFIKTPEKTTEVERQVILEQIPDISELNIETEIAASLQTMDSDKLRDIVENYKVYDYDEDIQMLALSILKSRGADINDIIDKQDYKFAESYLKLYDNSSKYAIIAYAVVLVLYISNSLVNSSLLNWFPSKSLIAYGLIYIQAQIYFGSFYSHAGISKKEKRYKILLIILSFIMYPVTYFYNRKKMKKSLDEITFKKYTN